MKTFVFTDIVRSVDLKSQMPGRSDAERDAAFVESVLSPHRSHIETGLSEAEGRVVSTAGDGHFLVFANPIDAADWAVSVQRRHRDEPIMTPQSAQVEVRMGLHVGFPQADPQDPHNFIGKVVDYTARLTDLATGGQLLVSKAALGLLQDAGMEGVDFHDHGPHELRGIGNVAVHELLYDRNRWRPLRTPNASRTEPTTDVAPVDADSREWTVLPPTLGLSEFIRQQGGSGSSGTVLKSTLIRKLGNYELGELIGAGGMGNVYKAHHSQFERVRAVKIIKPHFVEWGHKQVINRFYREIKLIGGLDHPNIVVAIDSSSPDDETHYLVMEYVDGLSSERLINRRRRLDPPDACEIVRQAAVGLEYIHRQGMVHRDIKPSNLMLTDTEASAVASTADGTSRRPRVKILDLGLGLLVTDDQPRLTRVDHGAMGTAMYMSPEQWSTTSVDIRADIYSLGCTLYHLLTGKPPYHDSDLKPQRAHELAPTPRVSLDGRTPEALDHILAKMMAKSPDDRYSRPAEVVEALAPLCKGSDLLTLLDKSRDGAPLETDARDSRETLPAGKVSDTLGPLPPLPSDPPSTTVPTPLHKRLVTPAVIVALAVVALLFGLLVRQQQATVRRILEDKLASVAPPLASSLADEINDRFNLLHEASTSQELLQAMEAINTAARPPTTGAATKTTKEERERWAPLSAWLTEQRRNATEKSNLDSSSWFVTDRFGRQVARHPPKETTGKWYYERDYFHGQGVLAENTTPAPITAPHQSAVYRSTKTKQLKVAFSTPIYDTDRSQVIGVLAMSLNLGDFKVLEDDKWVKEPMEVVLVDMRSDVSNQHGWLLHHRELRVLEDHKNPYRLPSGLLAQVDSAMQPGVRRADDRLREPIFRGYSDLLNRPDKGKFVGAFEPVVIRGPDRQDDTGWLVIVQEGLSP